MIKKAGVGPFNFLKDYLCEGLQSIRMDSIQGMKNYH